MFLIHDDDLKGIDEIDDGTVGGYLNNSYSVLTPRSAVTRSLST